MNNLSSVSQTKRRPLGRLFVVRKNYLIAFAAKSHQQTEQVNEDIVDVQEQRHGCHDVVGFAAVNDLADVEQDVCRKNQHRNRGDGQGQRRDCKEQVSERCDDQQDHADEQKLAHEAEIFFGDRGNRCQAGENNARSACRHTDQLSTVA